jgi:sulfur carrier protein
MKIWVNDEPRELPEGASAADLLRALGLHERRVAVLLNGEVVRRADLSARALREGDRAEVISMVGGG